MLNYLYYEVIIARNANSFPPKNELIEIKSIIDDLVLLVIAANDDENIRLQKQ